MPGTRRRVARSAGTCYPGRVRGEQGRGQPRESGAPRGSCRPLTRRRARGWGRRREAISGMPNDAPDRAFVVQVGEAARAGTEKRPKTLEQMCKN